MSELTRIRPDRELTYRIIESRKGNVYEMQQHITEWKNQGWETIGGVSVIRDEGFWVYCQAIQKPKSIQSPTDHGV